MQSISNILDSKKNLSAMWKGVDASLVVEFANSVLKDIFGDQILSAVNVIYFKNNAITVAALSSVAAQEIRLQESIILEKINEKFGKNKVVKIKYLA